MQLKHPRTRKTNADWPSARIVYELRIRRMSLRQLSLAAGFNERSLWKATHKAWPNGERIIAAALGISPALIWPSRYGAQR